MEKLKITAKKFWNGVNTFMHDESGMGTVEIILIIVEKYFISYSL
jgi:hypothetical protein